MSFLTNKTSLESKWALSIYFLISLLFLHFLTSKNEINGKDHDLKLEPSQGPITRAQASLLIPVSLINASKIDFVITWQADQPGLTHPETHPGLPGQPGQLGSVCNQPFRWFGCCVLGWERLATNNFMFRVCVQASQEIKKTGLFLHFLK